MQPIVYGNLDDFLSMFLNIRKNRIKYGKRLNYKFSIADINTDRKSYNAWRRYTVKIRGIDMVSVSLFYFYKRFPSHFLISLILESKVSICYLNNLEEVDGEFGRRLL